MIDRASKILPIGLILVGACTGDANPDVVDASDVTQTDATDTVQNDVQNDVQDDVVTVDTVDVAEDTVTTDASDDASDASDAASTCSTAPLSAGEANVNGWFGPPQFGVVRVDASGVGAGIFVTSFLHAPATSGTPMTFGDCTLWDISVPTSMIGNLGTITWSQGSMMATIVYDTAMGYVPMGFDSFNLMDRMDATVTIPGRTGFEGGTSTLPVPAYPSGLDFFTATPFDPTGSMALSRSTDTVVTWSTAGLTNEIMSVEIVDPNGNDPHFLQCAVRACAGRLTVPAAAVAAAWPTFSDPLAVQAGIHNVAAIAPTTREAYQSTGWMNLYIVNPTN